MTTLTDMQYITDDDLRNPANKNKYSIDVLENNVGHLSNVLLVCTQKITAEFYIRYIFIDDDDDDSEDADRYDMYYFLQNQPDVTEEYFREAYRNFSLKQNE